jgi:hypothetical protein
MVQRAVERDSEGSGHGTCQSHPAV